MLVFGVKNRDLNVVPGKGADRILGLPQRERDEHCPLTLVAPKHPRTPVPRSLTVLGEARLSDVFGILVGVGSEHRARPGARSSFLLSPRQEIDDDTGVEAPVAGSRQEGELRVRESFAQDAGV